jgi:hypothetical protein
MFNKLDSDLNAKDKFACELLERGVDGQHSVAGQGNGGGEPLRV